MGILDFPIHGKVAAKQPDSGLAKALDGFSIEVMPRTAAKVPSFSDILPAGTRVYIANIDGTPLDDMVATAKRLTEDGFAVMPHIPARMIESRAMLEEWLRRYRDEAGVDQALVLAGGLPTPRLLCARLTCDCVHRVFEMWADAFGAELFEIDHPGAGDLPPRWWELGRHQWRELVEPHRLAFMVSTLESLVERLEVISGRALDREALRERLELVNQQEEVFDDVRRLIASAPECPVRMTEQITNVMATQWVRGGEWALGHARAFRDEVSHRVEAGLAACPDERARLMWVGAGLWHDTGFYTAFESSHRAVFVWSMYLAFGPDGYIRYGLDDPMAALASRTASFNEYLHNPPWAAEWLVHQAREHRINGALVLRPRSMKPAGTGRLFIERALEEAGIPVLPIEGDVVDARAWDADAARADVRSFLDARVLQ